MDIKTALLKVDENDGSEAKKQAAQAQGLVGKKRKKSVDEELEKQFRKMSIESPDEDEVDFLEL